MSDALDRLFSQTSISMGLESLKTYHGVVTIDEKAQARQRLLGELTVLPPDLMASRLYAYEGDELSNPIEVHKLRGEVRMHFFDEEVFSAATRAGMLELIEPQEEPFRTTYWLSLELFLPERFFPRLIDTRLLSCTVTGLHVQRPLPEAGSLTYHWRSATQHRLTVSDAHFSASLPTSER